MTVADHGQDHGGKVEGSCELPLWSSLVGLILNYDNLQHAVVFVGDVVLLHEVVPDTLEEFPASALRLRLESVKDSSPNQEVSEGAHNKRKSTYILSLHSAFEENSSWHFLVAEDHKIFLQIIFSKRVLSVGLTVNFSEMHHLFQLFSL